jgi:hypothetical protein
MNIYDNLEELLDPMAVNFADGLLDAWTVYDIGKDHRKENALIIWAYDSRDVKGTGGRYVCQVATPDGILSCQIATAIVKGLELLKDKRRCITSE